MDICDACNEFAITISKREEVWYPPHSFWNAAQLPQSSRKCRLCKLIADYYHEYPAEAVRILDRGVASTLYTVALLEYFDISPYHKALSQVTVTECGHGLSFSVWSDPGSYPFQSRSLSVSW